MGLFDRKSTTTNQQEITNRNVAIEGTSGLTIAGSEGFQILDGGAIGGIRDTAIGAINAQQGGLSKALDFGERSLLAVGAAFEQAGTQTQKVLETTTGRSPSPITDNTLKTAIAAIVAGYGLWVIFRK